MGNLLSIKKIVSTLSLARAGKYTPSFSSTHLQSSFTWCHQKMVRSETCSLQELFATPDAGGEVHPQV